MLVQLHVFFVQKNKDKFEYKHRDLFWRSIAVLDVPEDSNKNNNGKYYDVVCTKSQESEVVYGGKLLSALPLGKR